MDSKSMLAGVLLMSVLGAAAASEPAARPEAARAKPVTLASNQGVQPQQARAQVAVAEERRTSAARDRSEVRAEAEQALRTHQSTLAQSLEWITH